MAWDSHSNFSKGTLTNSPGTAGTSFILGTGEGALFAANTPVTLVPDNTRPDKNNSEIGYVTAVASDTLTVTRTQQGSTNQNVQAGWLVLGTITAKALTDIETAVDGKADSSHTHTASNITDFNTAADARITNAVGTTVQAYDADLDAFAAKTAPSGAVVGTTDTQTLTNKTLALGSNTVSGTTAQFNTALTDGDFTTLAGTETLTNKTLTTPVISQIKASNGTIAFSNAAVASAVNYVELQGAATGAGPVITVGGSDTDADLVLQGKGTGLPKVFKSSSAREIVTTTGTETLSNKTLTAPKIANAGFIADANGNEEIIFTTTASAVNEITVANAATGGKPTITASGGDTNVTLNLVPKGTGTVQAGGVDVVTTSGTQTLTNKTLTTPVISSISNTGTLTLPTSTDTLVGRATTDTLTNKTLTSPVVNQFGTASGLGAAWSSWTPTWTNFTVGNGTLNYAKYMQIGKTVFFKVSFTLGSTSAVTGKITFSSPVTMATLSAGDVLDGSGKLSDVSVPDIKIGFLIYETTTTISICASTSDTTYTGMSASGTSSTIPFTWATSDKIIVAGTFEAA